MKISETIVNSDLDPSLTDNAAGYSNYTAPGADRLKLSVRLGKRSLDSDKNENFVELMVINGGSVSHIDDKIKYNELGNELARRTYSHAGDFYVKQTTPLVLVEMGFKLFSTTTLPENDRHDVVYTFVKDNNIV